MCFDLYHVWIVECAFVTLRTRAFLTQTSRLNINVLKGHPTSAHRVTVSIEWDFHWKTEKEPLSDVIVVDKSGNNNLFSSSLFCVTWKTFFDWFQFCARAAADKEKKTKHMINDLLKALFPVFQFTCVTRKTGYSSFPFSGDRNNSFLWIRMAFQQVYVELWRFVKNKCACPLIRKRTFDNSHAVVIKAHTQHKRKGGNHKYIWRHKNRRCICVNYFETNPSL